MADIKQLESALVKADAAGNADDARALAAEIRRMRSAAPEPTAKETTIGEDIAQGAGNLVAGAVRGAGSIGATILAPYDMAKDALAGKGLSLESNRQRRADMDAGLQSMGAQPDSLLYKGGKLAGEIAGTAGTGGVLAKGAQAVGAAPSVVNALASSGFNLGRPAAATIGGKVVDAAIRIGTGATVGATSAGAVNPSDAGTGAIIGGALPTVFGAIGKAGQKIGQSIRGGELSPEVAALAKRANDLGINIPADRLVDSKPLNALASSLNYVPFSGRAGVETKMQSQLNKALTRTFGQDSDNVTGALRKAGDALGTKFDDVLQNTTVKVDDEFLTALSGAEAKAASELGSDGERIIRNQINEILAKAQKGEIDGQAAYNIKKTLDRIGKRNSPEAFYAIDLKNDLMGALNRSLGPTEAAAFKTTRQQYGNMMALEKLAKNGVDGDISIGRLANLKNIGNNDLQELADIAAQFLKTREAPHGAAQRVGAAGLATYLGGPGALAAGVVGGRGTNMLLNSNAAKNFVMPAKNLANSAPTNSLLGTGFYRAAPLLGGDR